MSITFCVKLPRVTMKSVQYSLNLAAQKMWETERILVEYTVQTESKKTEDDERGVCLKRHRSTVFKPTLRMESGVVISVISCIRFILSNIRGLFKLNLISRGRERARFRHNMSYACKVLVMILSQFSLYICRQM